MRSLLYFWQGHPALLYGITLLLGIQARLTGSLALAIPCAALAAPFFAASLNREMVKQLSLIALTFLCAYIYTANRSTFPHLPSNGTMGTAHFAIKNLSLQPTPFGKNWVYRCEMVEFFPNHNSSSIASSLPFSITLSGKRSDRPPANREYWVRGKLIQGQSGSYLLKVSTKEKWKEEGGTWSWAEQRYHWKAAVTEWIGNQFSHSTTATFLGGLLTGEFHDYWMKQQFGRFGLQHLLAISGFHFAIIAAFLSLAFQLFLPRALRLVCLLICLAGYCFFLGPQPSILRAWIMCSLVLMGGLLEKKTNALNGVGLALLLILSYDPLLSMELGFQLSFAITAAILLFYRPALNFCETLFSTRGLSEVLQMNALNQHAYCLLAFFKQGLALTLAVNAIALPLTLFYFQQYPWMSLLYNLFFPFLASISLAFLLAGSLFAWIPVLGKIIPFFNDYYTRFILQLTYQIPLEVDYYLKVAFIHPAWLVLYLSIVYLWGAVRLEREHLNESEGSIFTYI